MGDSMDKLGEVIKNARLQADMSRKELAVKLLITPRHLMSLENGRHKPSYKLLFRLIRELRIQTDSIFYPVMTEDNNELDKAIAMLRMCGDRELAIITATLQSLIREQ